ncbi:hypothetical protein K466DRAFT_19482 [Polyporus arcularius HHB13444]|uniref:Uncharacterized protein n=1 Tax=Polyporus arcularius HHB13444 TaxID=1314778 RepID=A0A5C3PJY2_9APHY|nr:hypothetical protein K466DRAFT_19482 [Polyporus arcularius HHB13444]
MLVSAVPTQTSNAGRTKMMCKATRPDAEGAVYFITNETAENMIIVATIDADGALASGRGRGRSGLTVCVCVYRLGDDRWHQATQSVLWRPC